MHRLKQSFEHTASFNRKCKYRLSRTWAPHRWTVSGAHCNGGSDYQNYPLLAESASTAIVCSRLRNFGLWPMKSPSAMKLLIVATAPPNLSVSGRMIETRGRLGLNSTGTGKIRLG